MSGTLLNICVLVLCLISWSFLRRYARGNTPIRLAALAKMDEIKQNCKNAAPESWGGEELLLENLKDRLGRAGYLSKRERTRALWTAASWAMLCVLLGAVLGAKWGIAYAVIGAGVGIYLAFMGWLFYLSARQKEVERETLFRLPILLESIILLVEAGLGVLPALQRVMREENGQDSSVVCRILGVCHSLAASGIPFGQALSIVSDSVPQRTLKHVLLHLDISGTEGGELVPALRNLSEYVHNEWKLSVETRVKRLENLVVFPVFASVMGLLVLTSAVPLVPVLEFMDTLSAKQPQAVSALKPVGIGRSE